MTTESPSVNLNALAVDQSATISHVDWPSLDDATARRLQEFGVDEGISVQMLHHGPLGRDPIALRVGRMTIALRRSQAMAISVVPPRP